MVITLIDDAVGQQAITWAHVETDLYHHVASLGWNEYKFSIYFTEAYVTNKYQLPLGPVDYPKMTSNARHRYLLFTWAS